MMTYQHLVLDDAVALACRKVVVFAENPSNWFVHGDTSTVPPGRDDRYVANFPPYRCVFSITRTLDGRLWRHLSVSVPPEKNKERLYANPFVMVVLSEMFGFVSDAEDRKVAIDEDQHCVVVGEPYEAQKVAAKDVS
jgi:hypothetical protein